MIVLSGGFHYRRRACNPGDADPDRTVQIGRWNRAARGLLGLGNGFCASLNAIRWLRDLNSPQSQLLRTKFLTRLGIPHSPLILRHVSFIQPSILQPDLPFPVLLGPHENYVGLQWRMKSSSMAWVIIRCGNAHLYLNAPQIKGRRNGMSNLKVYLMIKVYLMSDLKKFSLKLICLFSTTAYIYS